jgi:hypothetical protein
VSYNVLIALPNFEKTLFIILKLKIVGARAHTHTHTRTHCDALSWLISFLFRKVKRSIMIYVIPTTVIYCDWYKCRAREISARSLMRLELVIRMQHTWRQSIVLTFRLINHLKPVCQHCRSGYWGDNAVALWILNISDGCLLFWILFDFWTLFVMWCLEVNNLTVESFNGLTCLVTENYSF